MRWSSAFVLAVALVATASAAAAAVHDTDPDRLMHSRPPRATPRGGHFQGNEAEREAAFWRASAQKQLRAAMQRRPVTDPANNLIMFLGDGMSIPTLAAARTYQGQQTGASGEEAQLFFETFPYTGLSKTYCVDTQVADSACSATAYLCGVKANIATIGVTAAVAEGDCQAQQNASTHVSSLLQWAQDAGKATGIVTTTRVTHASPAGAYAHTSHRDWESDGDVTSAGHDVTKCPDIAQQLITGETGKNFKVILGGGRQEFRPENFADEEGQKSRRKDGVDLVEVWKSDKGARNASHQFVWNRQGLLGVDYSTNDYLLGLFEGSHMMYHLDAIANANSSESEPTLAELVEAAIRTLQKEKAGFVLFVEGGRIDHGHHGTQAKHAVDEAVQMAEAVRTASRLTHEQDTLIVVTADHAHTMSISGYPDRGTNIFGVAGMADDKIAIATLSYANGPGYHKEQPDRHDISKDDTNGDAYEFPALAPLNSETHGGDDVAVLARGPFAHFLTGVFEQNFIPHAMAYAACIGHGATACADN